MKDIKIVKLNKYSTEKYKEVAYDIYLNTESNNYCFCFEADALEQYPLEDLLDQYSLNCTEYYGQEVSIGNEKKYVAEVETLSANKKDFIKILNFTTIIGKEINNINYNDNELLVINYGNSNFVMNGEEVHIPIYGYRNDFRGMVYFEVIYPEAQYIKMFTNNQNYNIELDYFDINNLKYILLQDNKAKIIYINSSDSKLKEFIFNLNGLENIINY